MEGVGEEPAQRNLRRNTMNWIFDTYSNVYSTAMMIEQKPYFHVETPKKTKPVSRIAKLFGRG